MTATIEIDLAAEYRRLADDYYRLDDADLDYKAKADVIVAQMRALLRRMSPQERRSVER